MNNKQSAPVITTALAIWLDALHAKRYSYNFLSIPKTLDSSVCLSLHLDNLKSYVVAGSDISWGSNFRTYSCVPAQNGHDTSDHTTLHTLMTRNPKYIFHTWRNREGDEHQRCALRIDQTISTIMRTRYDCTLSTTPPLTT